VTGSEPPATDPRQVVPPHADQPAPAPAPYDPLRLCVFATVALLGWVLGPVALLGFATLAVVGYAKARRAGLLHSRCKLGDTRLVLLYLTALAIAACVGIYFWID
jgi:hypothetical protein